MQTATFIKTIKWLYSLEMDEALGYFRSGFAQYLESGRTTVAAGIEDTYIRGIEINCRVQQIAMHRTAPTVLDVFGLSSIYDAEWWQAVVSAFLKMLATSEATEPVTESARESVEILDMLIDRMRILLSCVGPLQQLVVPSAVLRQTDYDETLTLEIYPTTGSSSPAVERVQAVLDSTDELYATMCRIHGQEDPETLRVLHMGSEDGYKFDLSGDGPIIVDLKKLLVDVWVRIRNQDSPAIKDLNRTIVSSLGPCQRIEERLASGELTQETAGQLRHQLAALAMKMFDQGVQIREIPDTDTVDNRRLMEQISQRRLPRPEVAAADVQPTAQAAGGRKRKTPDSSQTAKPARRRASRSANAKATGRKTGEATKRKTRKKAA